MADASIPTIYTSSADTITAEQVFIDPSHTTASIADI